MCTSVVSVFIRLSSDLHSVEVNDAITDSLTRIQRLDVSEHQSYALRAMGWFGRVHEYSKV